VAKTAYHCGLPKNDSESKMREICRHVTVIPIHTL
jgi:hypothetical protein